MCLAVLNHTSKMLIAALFSSTSSVVFVALVGLQLMMIDVGTDCAKANCYKFSLDASNLCFPSPQGIPRPMAEQYLGSACCASFDQREAALVLQIIARQIWPCRARLSQ